MEENIEVKDVHRTEYLDKNGLDMLWAKVKENTHNQVEVERNRAVAKENSIIDTKADKSALDNYVLSTTLTALEQKVTANTTAIEGKQDAGNYIKYERIIGDYGPDGRYLIHCGIHLDTYSGNSDVIIDKDGILVSKHNNSSEGFSTFRRDIIKTRDNRAEMHVTSNEIASYKIDTSEPSGLGDANFQLRSNGVRLYGGDNNHVLTSNASTIDITQYVLKSVYDEKIAALEARIAALEAKHTETA